MRVKAGIAQQIYDIRNKLRMRRDDLAEFSGLTPETIEDIEESDYDGDWGNSGQEFGEFGGIRGTQHCFS